MSDAEWKVREHGPIVPLAENLRWVSGSLPGMSLRRTMVVVRLADGRLLIHNGIAMDEAEMAELEAWGAPAFLVVPNAGHRLDAAAYVQRYPSIVVIAPEGGREAIEKVVRVDRTYDETPVDDPAVRFETLDGVAEAEGAMIVTSNDGVTVVLNDCVMNMDRKRDPLGFLFTTALGSAPGPRVSRLVKFMFVKDKAGLRAHLQRLAAIPGLIRFVVAHEKVASGPDAAAALRRACAYL